MRFDDIPSSEWIQALCIRLRVEFVISGSIQTKQRTTLANVYVHGKNDKSPVAKAIVTGNMRSLSGVVLRQLASAANTSNAYLPLKSHLVQFANNNVSQDNFSELSDAERTNLFAATGAIEQAIDYVSGNPEGMRILKDAEKKLADILTNNPKQPFVYSLLASCKFNLAKAMEGAGENAGGKTEICRMY